MLKVTIVNIDGSFQAIYDHDDKAKAVEALLATLIANRGFFADNRIVTEYPPFYKPNEGMYGVLAMPGETEDEEEFRYMLESENTYEIYVAPYEPGEVITDRD